MKKLYNLKSKLAMGLICLGAAQITNAQVSTQYTFSQASNVYTTISNGTVVGNNDTDDGTYLGNIGFSFRYNGVCYNQFFMSSNGTINFGSTFSSSTYNFISSGNGSPSFPGAYFPVIAAFNADSELGIWVSATVTIGSPVVMVSSVDGISVGDEISSFSGGLDNETVIAVGANSFTASANASSASSQIRFRNGKMQYKTTGVAPNRKLTAQWSNIKQYGNDGLNDNQNYQIILEENTNKISIMYGKMAKGLVSNIYEIGLSGGSATDYNNRTNTTNWTATTAGIANDETCTLSNSIFPASGLTFIWTPPTVAPPTVLINATGPTNFCVAPGTTTLTASGASAYLWYNGSASLSVTPTSSVNTTYSVIGTGTNCASTVQTISITISPNPTVTINGTSTYCANLTGTITASGANTYTWSNGSTSATINPTIAATYSVTGTVNGCTGSASQLITLNPVPNVTLTVTGSTLSCTGGTLTNLMTASGTTTFSWSTGASTNTINPTTSVTTTYQVVGTALNGCSNTKTQIINLSNNNINIVSSNSVICAGQSASLTATGGTTYTWSTASNNSSITVTPTVTATYTVSGTNSGCLATAVFTQSVTPNNIGIATSNSLICAGQQATLTAAGGTTYTWSTASNSKTITITPTTKTSYTVTGTNLGCSAKSVFTQSVSACTSIEDLENNKLGVSIYPNPNNGTFTINLLNGLTKTIEITDVTGRLVFVNTTANDNIEMNIDQLNGGIYYVKVISNNRLEVVKIIKQ